MILWWNNFSVQMLVSK